MATAADFLIVLPQFESVEPDTITAWLASAARFVDTTWGDDQDRAQIYLAAHLMSIAGIGPEKGAQTLAAVKQLTSGGITIIKDDSLGDLGLTSFGRLFSQIQLAVVGGAPLVTGTGDYPYPYTGMNLDAE